MKKIVSIMLAFAMVLSLLPQTGDVVNAQSGEPGKPKHKVKYVFESGTEGKPLPPQVVAVQPPESEAEEGATVNPPLLANTVIRTDDGSWTFDKWTPATAVMATEDLTFKGKWNFKALEKADVTFTITEFKNETSEFADMRGTKIIKAPVEVKYFDLADYGMQKYYRYESAPFDQGGGYINNIIVEKPTLLHAIIKFTEKYYLEPGQSVVNGTDTMTATGAPTSMFFQKLWGHDYNFNYYFNGEYPLMKAGFGATADYILLKDGDTADFVFFPQNGSDYQKVTFGRFDKKIVSLSTGKKTDLVFTGRYAKFVDNVAVPSTEIMKGEKLRVSGDEGKTWFALDGKTDSDGKIKFHFRKPGTYIMTSAAKIENQDRRIMALPVCKFVVTGDEIGSGDSPVVTDENVAPKKVKVKYRFTSETAGHEPTAQLNALLPAESEANQGDTVTPANPAQQELNADGGKWIFLGWDKGEVVAGTEDITFTGKWKFTATKTLKVKHRFASKTPKKKLPKEIRDILVELEDRDTEEGETESPTQIELKDVEVLGGKWHFEGWDKNEVVVGTEDVIFTGYWKFTKQKPKTWNMGIGVYYAGTKAKLRTPKGEPRKKLVWKSSNNRLVRVNKGYITLRAPGATTVKATYKNKIFVYSIRISPKKLTSFRGKVRGKYLTLRWKPSYRMDGAVIYRAVKKKGKYVYKALMRIRGTKKTMVKLYIGRGKVYGYKMKAYKVIAGRRYMSKATKSLYFRGR